MFLTLWNIAFRIHFLILFFLLIWNSKHWITNTTKSFIFHNYIIYSDLHHLFTTNKKCNYEQQITVIIQTNGSPYIVLSKRFGRPNTNGIHSQLLYTPYAYNHLIKKYFIFVKHFFNKKTSLPSLSVGVLHLGQGFVNTLIVTLEASSQRAPAALEGSTL